MSECERARASVCGCRVKKRHSPTSDVDKNSHTHRSVEGGRFSKFKSAVQKTFLLDASHYSNVLKRRSQICSFGHYSYVGVMAKWPNGKMTNERSNICLFGHYSYVGVMAKWPNGKMTNERSKIC